MSEARKENVLHPVNRVKRYVEFSDEESFPYGSEKTAVLGKLQSLKESRAIIESRIKGVEIRKTGGKSHVFAISLLLGCEVLIRDDDYFLPGSMKDFYYSLPEEEKIKSKVQRLNVRINARTVFVIREIREESGIITVVASRTEAMLKRRKRHFFIERGDSDYRVVRGSVVECDVLSVGERGCLVSCCGVEFLIDSEKLSGKVFIDDCRKFFRSGDVISGLVSKFYFNQEKTDVEILKVSPKAYDTYLMGNNLSKITVGGIYSGQVRSYSRSAKPKYIIILDVGVIAQIETKNINNTRFLQLGERVVVKVLYKNEGYVSGWAIKSAEAIRY